MKHRIGIFILIIAGSLMIYALHIPSEREH